MIRIIHCGIGNVWALHNMLRRLGAEVNVASSPDDARDADKLLLPGVGAFDTAMAALTAQGWVPLLEDMVLGRGLPLLGICLGMQLLTRSSEEGMLPGLGFVKGRTRRFAFEDKRVKIPHTGWNHVSACTNDPMAAGLVDGARFYFIHSYHVCLDAKEDALFETEYAGMHFTSAFRKGNVIGVQFHPEKSHRFGKILLGNFMEL